MMSLATIKAMQREAAYKAMAEKKTPFIYWNEGEVDEYERFPFPFLGDYVPEGWELVDQFFVDATGLGQDWEPALSVRQFRELLKEKIKESREKLGHNPGWAIVEAGQFQVYVGQYQRVSS